MAGKPRPKLLILDGDKLPVGELKAALEQRFEVVESMPGDVGQPSDLMAVVSLPGQVGGTVSDTLSQRLLESLPEAVCLCDPAGRLVWGNRRFAQLPQETQDALLQAIFERSPSLHEPQSASGNKTDDTVIEVAIDKRAGPFYEIHLSRQEAAEGEDERVAALVRDVTRLRGFQRRLGDLNAAGADLVRLDAEQVRGMNAVERLEVLESKIVETMHNLLHFDHFTVRLIDERSKKLEVVINRGLPPEIMEIDLYPELEGNGITGHVAATGRSYICNDPDEDELFMPGMAGAGSTLTVPLRLHDEVIGVLDIESDQRGAFSQEDRRLAELLAGHLALALHILDLLVVERSQTNESACGRVEGELSEPLDDILAHVETLLSDAVSADPGALEHIKRIKGDVESIRRRVRNVAAGPQTLLGVERALTRREKDPMLLGRRVLVADDQSKIRRIIGDVLSHRGCEVTLCTNGGEAIKLLEAAARGDLPAFDLVLSDIKMPDRNGYEVFSAVRRLGSLVPVILMTGFGYDPHHSIVRASQEGLAAVLFKPFQIERMIDEVRKAMPKPDEDEPVAAKPKP